MTPLKLSMTSLEDICRTATSGKLRREIGEAAVLSRRMTDQRFRTAFTFYAPGESSVSTARDSGVSTLLPTFHQRRS